MLKVVRFQNAITGNKYVIMIIPFIENVIHRGPELWRTAEQPGISGSQISRSEDCKSAILIADENFITVVHKKLGGCSGGSNMGPGQSIVIRPVQAAAIGTMKHKSAVFQPEYITITKRRQAASGRLPGSSSVS